MKDYLLKLPQELHSKIKVVSYTQGKTMMQFILEAINEKLEKENKK